MKKIYIEAGANDGIFQSCTLNLEQTNEWFGLLIEPNPDSYASCIANRSAETNRFFNCALVPFGYKENHIILYKHEGHSAMAGVIKREDTKYIEECKVPCRTLQSILDEMDINHIDKMFLDVEGYELDVLKGTNFNKVRFEEIEVEVHSRSVQHFKHNETEKQDIIGYMDSSNYVCVKQNDSGNANVKLIFQPKA